MCLIQNGHLLCFILTAIHSGGHSPVVWTFLLVAIHVVIGTLWSLTLIIATRYAAAVLKSLQ